MSRAALLPTATLALAASLAPAHAGVDPGSVRVAREGPGVRLVWSGALEPGASWTLLRGTLPALVAGGRDEAPVVEGLTRSEALDGAVVPGTGSFYWLVEDRGPILACNGRPQLCDRPYDEVAHATTHNAMSSEADGWILPNQGPDVPAQLAAGIRALMLDIHDFLGEPHLCHGTCLGGFRPLDDGLAEIRAFLEANPREVVTLILECYSSVADVEAAFAASGLLPLCHEQAAGAPWPTLGELIDSGRRVVVLTDSEGGARPWYHDVWAHAWETPFAVERPADFTCARNRGTDGNALFILNHFLTAPAASRSLAAQVNFNPDLLDRARACEAQSGRIPNFVTVDFFDVGDVLAAVDSLNDR